MISCQLVGVLKVLNFFRPFSLNNPSILFLPVVTFVVGYCYIAGYVTVLPPDKSIESITSPLMSIALCISGQIRSLAQSAHRQNFLQTFVHPIKDLNVKIFMDFNDDLQARNPAVLQAIRMDSLPVNITVTSTECSADWCSDPSCIRKGYEQFKRLDSCMDMIVAYENSMKIRFDFVIRTRPDLILTASLPGGACWLKLRRDIVWDSAAKFNAGSAGKIVETALNTDFVADFFHILLGSSRRGYARHISFI